MSNWIDREARIYGLSREKAWDVLTPHERRSLLAIAEKEIDMEAQHARTHALADFLSKLRKEFEERKKVVRQEQQK